MTQGPDPQNPHQPSYPQQGESPQPYGAGQPGGSSGWNPQGDANDPQGTPGWGQQGGYGDGAQPASGWDQQGGYPPAQQGYPATQAYPAQPGYPATQAYPAQQGYPATQAYPAQQSYPAAQGYPATHGYPQAQMTPSYGQPAARQHSPILGMIALGGVVVCGVVLSWLMWRMGALVGPLALASGGNLSQEQLTQELMDQLGAGGLAALNVAGYVGVAAWITGIIATATRRGRAYGVWAIILGVLAPVVAVIMMVAAMMPYLG